MRSIFNKLLSNKNVRADGSKSDYGKAKAIYRLRLYIKRESVSIFLLALGVLSAGFGLRSFLLPNDFIDGGVTGISLLVSHVTGINLSFLIVILNIPFIVLGYTQIGKGFVVKASLAIICLAIVIAFVPYPILTADKLLVSVFGGFFIGAGIGLAVRGGGVLDGTEVMALHITKKSGLTIGDIILTFNVIIFSVAAWLLSFETALYSILAYLSASKSVDFIIEGVEEYTGVTIISSYSDEIRIMLTEKLGRGVTVYKGTRGFGKTGNKLGEIDILYSVITRLEISKLYSEIEKIDINAFVVMSSIKDTKGGMIKKRPLH